MTHKGARNRNQQSTLEEKGVQNHDISRSESSWDHETKSSLLGTRLTTTKTASRHKLPFWEQCGLCSPHRQFQEKNIIPSSGRIGVPKICGTLRALDVWVWTDLFKGFQILGIIYILGFNNLLGLQIGPTHFRRDAAMAQLADADYTELKERADKLWEAGTDWLSLNRQLIITVGLKISFC